MRGFGFVPEWNEAPSRTNEHAYFPVSLSATVREATFSETLAGILGADPQYTIDDLREAVEDLPTIAGDERKAERLWDAFIESYSTSSTTRGSSAQEQTYLIPFHQSVATAIKVDQRNWARLYWLLMTDGEGEVNKELHDDFVTQLEKIDPSNLLESLIVKAIYKMENGDEQANSDEAASDDIYRSIWPLVPKCGEMFRKDLRAWLNVFGEDSAARWMRGLRDILCYHYMMYVLQVAISLDEEYKKIAQEETDIHDFKLEPIYFGLANETASQSRQFATTWEDDGIGRALYDSWGRLAVLSVIVDKGLDESTAVENKPYTLTEALNEFPEPLQDEIVETLLDHFPEDQRPNDEEYDLAETAIRFSYAVRRYYENQGKTRSAQTAWSAGENSLIDLGKGTERQFIERRPRVGVLLRLDRAGLRLFARLFDHQRERGHIDEFWNFMRDRGMQFDRRTKQEIINQLEGMGLLQKQSDSGEAMYVETV